MRKWWWAPPLLAALALGGYVVAGPYLAIRGITQAVQQQDTARLQRYVDFPALRVSLKAQLHDHVLRRAGPDLPAHPLGALALSLAGSVTGAGVDAMVTPLGIGALLQGRSLWKRASADTAGGDVYAPPAADDPLGKARHRFESASRFSATVTTDDGQPVAFVFTRAGLRWKLTDIRLPLQAAAAQ